MYDYKKTVREASFAQSDRLISYPITSHLFFVILGQQTFTYQ